MNYRSTIYSIIAIGYCLGCCPDKENPGLPPVTSEGKNTFACKINGEIFVADGSGTDTPNRGIYAVLEANFDMSGRVLPIDSSDLIISATNGSRRVFLYVNHYLFKHRHYLNNTTEEYPAIVNPKNYGRVYSSGHNYITSSVDTGSVFISRWDIEKRIIAGTFQFRAKSYTSKTDIVQVTEGRFDLDYSKTH